MVEKKRLYDRAYGIGTNIIYVQGQTDGPGSHELKISEMNF